MSARDDRPWRETWGEDMSEGISDSTHGMLGCLAVACVLALLVWAAFGGGMP